MQGLKKHFSVVLLLILTTTVYAQQLPNSVTLKQLLRQVDQKAPALISDSAAILIRKAQAEEVADNWLPNLKLNYQSDIGTNNNVAGPYFGFGLIPSNSRGVRASNNINTVVANVGVAAFDWEIYNFGTYSAQNKVATSDIKVEQYHFAQSKYQLQAFAIDSYLQLSRLHDFLAIQLRNIKRNEEIKRSVRSLAKSGIRPGVDTSIAEAELSKARLNYMELLDQTKQVQLQLSALSGFPYQAIIPDTSSSSKLINNFVLDNLHAADTVNHPLLTYYRSVYQNNLERENLVKKSYNPKIMLEGAAWGRGSSVDANDHFNALSSGFGFNRNNYLVGLGITYNLFDLKRRQLRLNTQKAITDYAKKKLQEESELLSISDTQSNVEMNTAMERLKEIPNQLKAATAGYKQKLSLYKNGLTDIIELNAALNILYRAETDYIGAKYSYSHALFQKAITENQVNNILNLLN